MKKRLTCGLVLLLLLCAFQILPRAYAAEAASGTCGENLTWTLDDAGTMTISGTGAMRDYEILGETDFGQVAARVKKVIVQEGVTRIGDNAFDQFYNMTEIVLPSSVTAIGARAFVDLPLQQVTLSSGLTTIGDYAFSQCTGLKEIQLPDTVTTIGERAFRLCKAVSELTLPKNLTTIGSQAFAEMTGLKAVTVPAGVTGYGANIFEGCTSLENVTLPAGIKALGEGMFQDCTGLKEIQLPDSLVTLGKGVFRGCTGLTKVNIPKAMTAISEEAFSGCSGLSGWQIPGHITSIGAGAFENCSGLTEITIPGGVTRIEDGTFAGCAKLVDVTIPEGVEFIGDRVFLDCGSMVRLTLPASLENLGKEVFNGHNPGLVYFQGSTPKHGVANAFRKSHATILYPAWDASWSEPTGDPGPTSVCVPKSQEKGIVANGLCGDGVTWKLDNKGKLTISGTGEMWNAPNYQKLPFKAFAKEIKSLVIQDGVTYVGQNVFQDCVNLTSISLPGTLTWIDNEAFRGCTRLAKLTLPKSLNSVGVDIFADCVSLKTVVIPGSISDPNGMFEGCTGLTRATLEEGVQTVGGFAGCTSLTRVDIPQSATRIGSNAFTGCTSLAQVTIPEGVTVIGANAFQGCTKLSSMTLPASVIDLGAEAFQDCTGLKSILLPGVVNINSKAFMNCTSLTGISFSAQLQWLDQQVLTGCTSLTSVRFHGDAPRKLSLDLQKLSTTVFYPAGNTTWEATVRDAKGTTVWVAESRLAGNHRFETALLAADQMKANLGIEKFDAVVVASGMDFADALSGSYLAAVNNAPILLACQVEKYNNEVKAYILENLNQGGTVYILGGENAVPASFETGLEGFDVERLAGSNRFDTNLKVLNAAGVGDSAILVATGLNFADCLSASAAQLPILLVYGTQLLPEQEVLLAANQGRELYIIGGTGAVSAELEAQIKGYGSVTRLAGSDRFETSVLIAETFFENPGSAVLAYGGDFPDGLCGGSLATTMGAPLLLTMHKYETQAADYIREQEIRTDTVLGGEKLIP